MNTRRAAFVLLTLVIAILACREPAGPTEPRESFQLGPLPQWLERGDTIRVQATAVHFHPDGRVDTLPGIPRIQWSSSNPLVATVDSGGLITALTAGFTTISAFASGSGVAFEFVVVERFVALRLTPDNASVVPDDRIWLQATAVDSSGAPVFTGAAARVAPGLAVQWAVTDSTIARLDPLYPGLLAAGQEGATQVTATLAGRSGSTTITVEPVTLTQVVTGASYACGLSDQGRPYCWGAIAGLPGALDEWWHPSYVPREILPRTRLATLTGGGAHVCGLDASGAAYCWGSNVWGQLGDSVRASGVRLVPGGHHFSTITAGGGHTCALEVDGTLYCWGRNGAGQVGVDSGPVCGSGGKFNNQSVCRPQPTVVAAAPAFVSVSAGKNHTCGVIASGQVSCWGRVGGVDGSTPTPVSSPAALASAASGAEYACGLTAAGAAYCWGENPRGLGDGATFQSGAAVAVAGGLTFRQINSYPGVNWIPTFGGSVGTCGTTTNDAVYCWGGQGEFADSVPAPVDGGVAFATVAAGSGHLCGVARDGVVYCWGYNEGGVAGVPESQYFAAPRRVAGQR